MSQRVGEGACVDVNPDVLRSWADCATWADLDYFIAARGSMIQLQAMFIASDARQVLGLAQRWES